MRLELFARQPPVRLAQHSPDQVLGLSAQMHIVREVQVIPPINDLAIDIVRVLRAERRVSCGRGQHGPNPNRFNPG
jgi:hypothetical protein